MKLYGKLLLSMIAAGAIALIALALTLNWRIGQGFIDFVNASEAERLPAVAASLAEHYAEAGNWETLRGRPRAWREVLARARQLEDETQPATPRTDPPASPARAAPRPVHEHWTPYWARMGVFDSERQTVIGRHDFIQTHRQEPVVVAGETVGWVGLHELREVRSHIAESFLRGQRVGLFWASLAMLAILAISAALLARAWTRPIQRIAEVARRMASGDFAARVATQRRDEIGHLARDMDFLAHSLEEADASRKRWMADAAHELRTPLAVLKGELEAIQDGIRPMDAESLASLHAEAAHLGDLIEELRELAQVDIGALDYRMGDVDLAATMRECLDSHRGRLAQAGLEVELVAPDAPVVLRGDPRRLRQLAENLIENSRRYTNSGGRLQVSLDQEHDRIHLRFDDSEPGVPAALLPRLFDPFVRGGSARTRADGGSGLGLAICRRIVEAHGGRISASPGALGGLAIDITLPRTPASHGVPA